MNDHEYSQGICGDGAAILKDGQPMTIEQIVQELREGQAARAQDAEPVEFRCHHCGELTPQPKPFSLTVVCHECGHTTAATIAQSLARHTPVSQQVPEWLSVIEDECWDLRCTSEPTGGDDYDVLWHVVEHHEAEPKERVIGTGQTPIDALRRAQSPLTACDWCGEEYPDDMMQNETQSGDALCDVCATQPPKEQGQ